MGPHLWELTAVRDLFSILLVLGLVWFGYYLRAIFSPVLVALALAYIFNPLINHAAKKWKLPRLLSISLIVLGVVVLGIICTGAILKQMVNLAAETPKYTRLFFAEFGSYLERMGVDRAQVETQALQYLEEFKKDPMQKIVPLFQTIFAGGGQIADAVINALGGTMYFVLTLMLIPLYYFFFALHINGIIDFVRHYLPVSSRQRTIHIMHKMDIAISAFVRTRLLISLMMGIMFIVGWRIAGVPYALLLGMLAGVASIIPYGAIIPLPAAILFTYLAPETQAVMATEFPWATIFAWPMLVYAVIQFLEGWIFIPVIQGKSMNLDTVSVIIIIFVGAAMGGLYGLLLCIPIAACIKIYLTEVTLPRLREWAQSN